MSLVLQGNELVPWRYKISSKNKVNAFVPAEIPSNADMGAVRSSVIGAAYHGIYNKIPCNDKVKLLWEAAVIFCVFRREGITT